MPIYEYECRDCGHELEAMRKISDDPLTLCPSCGADSLAKRISKVAFRLKGTGWYETDFKNKKPEKTGDAKADKADGSDGDKAGEKKGEAAKSDDTTKADDKKPAKTVAKSDD